jgi:hypothetical protein
MGQSRGRITCLVEEWITWAFDFDEVPLGAGSSSIEAGKIDFKFAAQLNFRV